MNLISKESMKEKLGKEMNEFRENKYIRQPGDTDLSEPKKVFLIAIGVISLLAATFIAIRMC